MTTLAEEFMCRCRTGVMRLKAGRHGEFFGCSRWPECGETVSVADAIGVPPRGYSDEDLYDHDWVTGVHDD